MGLAHEDLYEGAPLAHVAAYYDRMRLKQIKARNSRILQDKSRQELSSRGSGRGGRRLLRIVS